MPRRFALAFLPFLAACAHGLDLGYDEVEPSTPACPPSCTAPASPTASSAECLGCADGGVNSVGDGAGGGDGALGSDGALGGDGATDGASGPAGTWTVTTTPALLQGDLRAVWGRGPREVWAVGGNVLRFDGLWTVDPSPTTAEGMNTVWGTANEVRAQGYSGFGIRRTGSAWSLDSAANLAVMGLWGTSESAIWAVGSLAPADGRIFHFDGANWLLRRAAAGAPYSGVWGSSTSDVWAVGLFGNIDHYDGATWSVVVPRPSGADERLYGIWGRDARDVWAVGAQNVNGGVGGKILHWDGATWTASSFMPSASLNAVWASSARDVWAVGRNGILVHYDGTAWQNVPSPVADPTKRDELKGLWGSGPNDVWAVGGKTILHLE